MRPPRADIAAPPWPPGLDWVGGGGRAMELLTARSPVLVHFFDFAQLNSLRSLPYLRAWAAGYREHGLVTVAVHSPRFPFTREPEAVASAAQRLEIDHPIALDSEHRVWRDYGCRAWPTLFLWGRGGALRWYHPGEGDYDRTEAAIREALSEGEGEGEWPDPVEPLRPTDLPGAKVVVPSEEIFPGGSPERPWPGDGERTPLEVTYEAGGAYASVDGEGALRVSLDGGPARPLSVREPGLVELAAHERHQSHSLRIGADPGVAVYSISFAPGVP